jgi:predicted nucleotidyltransferase
VRVGNAAAPAIFSRASMSATAAIAPDPVLVRFRKALNEIYGGQIERVVLFGSRARGDAREDSDYDIAVFLRDMTDRFAEMNRLADLATDILYSEGQFIHAMPYRAGLYTDNRMPLMYEIRADGIDL